MARIALDSRTATSITVYMAELDTSYNGTTRNIFWNIKKTSESSYTTVRSGTIANQISQTSTYNLSGLTPSTSYDIKCIINNISGTGSVTFTRTIWTLDPDEPDEPDEPSWTRYTRSAGTIESDYERSIDLDEYELYRFSVSFSNSGTATFYTTGSVDTYGYLGTTSGWDSDSGTPSSYIARNDDGGSGSNFSISYDVIADTTYYVWVRGFDGTDTGSVVLHITAPTPTVDKWVWSFSIGDSLSVDSHGVHPMTATEWNNFTTRINEFRAYLGDDPATFTTVTQYQKFTPSIYNEAVYAIKSAKDGNSYGAFVDYINNSTLAISNSVFRISLLNSLASEANAMAGYT